MCADNRFWQCGDVRLPLQRTLMMGILNVTPDSFSDGGSYADVEQAVAHGLALVEQGADILDIGGESTRPGALPVTEAEELDRILPVIEQLRRCVAIPISVDTYKASVAQQALAKGARIINDISGLTFDPRMAALAAASGCGLVIMHIKGTPRDMQIEPHYDDVIREIAGFLSGQIKVARQAGVQPEQIMVDPGIGFGKRVQDNFTILSQLGRLQAGAPILVGPSRKSFIGTTLNLPVEERLAGTIAAATAAILHGAAVIRVHDVREMKRAAIIADAIKQARVTG